MGGQGTWFLPYPQQIPAIPSPHNTLYLELWCPAVAPSIVVTSDKGKTVINFGDIAAGVSRSEPSPHAHPHPSEPSPHAHPFSPGLPHPPPGLGL